MNYTQKKFNSDMRLEACYFIQQICEGNPMTLQMFIACNGLPVLVEFMDEVYYDKKELVWMAVDALICIFELSNSVSLTCLTKNSMPKNDFCRILSKNGIMQKLANTLSCVIKDQDSLSSSYRMKIVKLFLIFSQADSSVKKCIALQSVLRRKLFT